MPLEQVSVKKKRKKSSCDLNSAARVSRFFWCTKDVPDDIERKSARSLRQGQKTMTHNKNGINTLKKTHFCDVHFSHWVFHLIFLRTPTWMFLDPPKGELKPRKGLESWLPHRIFRAPGPPKGAHSDRIKGLKARRAFRVLRDERGPRASEPPCIDTIMKNNGSVVERKTKNDASRR